MHNILLYQLRLIVIDLLQQSILIQQIILQLEFLLKKKYSIQRKSNIYNLVIVDRNLLFDKNRKIDKKTKLLSVAIQQYYKKLIFNIVKIAIYNIVLEISQLKQYNSEVDQNIQVFRFVQYNYIIYI